MSEWKKYYRSGSAEARPYVAGESLDGISVSAADAPAVGGMVFRNPDNHADMWYVAEDWFKKNYGDGGEIAALRARVRELEERDAEIELAWKKAREAMIVYCIGENYHTRHKDILSGRVSARRATIEMYGPERARDCVRTMDAALAGGGKGEYRG